MTPWLRYPIAVVVASHGFTCTPFGSGMDMLHFSCRKAISA